MLRLGMRVGGVDGDPCDCHCDPCGVAQCVAIHDDDGANVAALTRNVLVLQSPLLLHP